MKFKFLFVLIVLILTSCGSPPPELTVGAQIPAFELANLQGKKLSSEQLIDKPTIINFWATWCSPCKKELPELIHLAEEGVSIIGISLDQTGPKSVQTFVNTNKINYPILMGDQETFSNFSGISIPYTIVVDGKGTVISIHSGPVTKEKLSASLEKASASS